MFGHQEQPCTVLFRHQLRPGVGENSRNEAAVAIAASDAMRRLLPTVMAKAACQADELGGECVDGQLTRAPQFDNDCVGVS